MSEKSLVTKLAEVMKEIGHVPKRGKNTFHNYQYVMEADLCDAVREKLAARNIMMVPSVTSIGREPVGGDSDQMLTSVMVEYSLMDGDSDQIIKFSMPGAGADKGDKGVYKAITGSDKYALMKCFLIPTGDDPEGDAETDARAEGFRQGSQQERKALVEKKLDTLKKEVQERKSIEALPEGEQVIRGVLMSISKEMPAKNGKPFVAVEIGGYKMNIFEKSVFQGKGGEKSPLHKLWNLPVACIVKKDGKYLNFVAIERDSVQIKGEPEDPFALTEPPEDESLPF
jgi:hypothetical protein